MNARIDGWILPPVTSFWFLRLPCSWGRCGLQNLLIRDQVVPDWWGEVEQDCRTRHGLIWGLWRDASCNVSLNSLAIVSFFLETTNREWIYINEIIDI